MQLRNRALTFREAVVVCMLAGVLIAVVYFGYRVVTRIRHDRGVEARLPEVLNDIRAQRQVLVGVINSYRSNFGFYPPSRATNRTDRAVLNPLYYELIGARWNPARNFFNVPTTKDPIRPELLKEYFNVSGFSNSVVYPDWPTNFLQGGFIGFQSDEGVIGVGYLGEEIPEDLADGYTFSTWRYAAEPAEHNKAAFDLWIEVKAAGKQFVIGNWPAVE